jgi:hypothetical protein
VEAAERLVYEGERGFGGIEEERIVVAANKAVEVCEFGWCKAIGVPWRDVPILPAQSSVSYLPQKTTS